MYNKVLTKCSVEDYLLLGRIDAWKKGIKNDIVNEILLTEYSYDDKLERLKNYFLGYKIGKLEILLSKCEDIVCFDFSKMEFTKLTEDEIIKTDFRNGYETFERESLEYAKRILI